MNELQELILDHYHNPRNYLLPSWVPTHTAKLQNLSCGDEIEIFLNIKSNKVLEVAFQGEGCSISIASASLLTETIKGKPLKLIKNLSSEDILGLIGITLTPSRIKCALLSFETLNEALNKKDKK